MFLIKLPTNTILFSRILDINNPANLNAIHWLVYIFNGRVLASADFNKVYSVAHPGLKCSWAVKGFH